MVSGDVELDVAAGVLRFVVRDGVQGVTRVFKHLALRVGVAAAAVEPDAVPGAVQHVASDSAQVASCVGRAAGSFCRRSGGGSSGGRRAGGGETVVWFDVWDGVHAAARVVRAFCASCLPGGGGGSAVRCLGRRAYCGLRESFSWCFLSAWPWGTSSRTW